MANDNGNSLENRYSRALYFSIAIFGIVFILTVGLYFYNMKLNSNITNLNTKMATLDDSLKKINEDDKVKLYTLIKSNTKLLDEYKKLSNIPQFIENLKSLSKDYLLTLNDFSYSNSKITTQCEVKDDDISLASQKVEKFIGDFRKADNKNIFSLGFVNDFQGQSEIKFTTEFKVK